MSGSDLLDGLLGEGVPRRQLDAHIHSVMTEARSGFYDKSAWIYDLIVGGRLYNRLFWGCPVARYRSACAHAVAAADGPVVDIGCGSLIFTAEIYAGARDHPIILVDRSIAMLERARDRLLGLGGGWPEHVVLLQANAMDLPFATDSVARTLSWGVLHVMPDPAGLVGEARRITKPGGTAHLSVLVTDRLVGRPYLRLLHATGEVAAPLSSADVSALLSGQGLAPVVSVVGNMAFIVADKNGDIEQAP